MCAVGAPPAAASVAVPGVSAPWYCQLHGGHRRAGSFGCHALRLVAASWSLHSPVLLPTTYLAPHVCCPPCIHFHPSTLSTAPAAFTHPPTHPRSSPTWQDNYVEGANVPDDQQQANYELAQQRLAPWADRTVFLRMFTNEAALLVPDTSLDWAYVGAR